MEFYIKRLMMCGYNITDAVRLVVSFGREGDFEGLEEWVKIAEARKRAGEYDVERV